MPESKRSRKARRRWGRAVMAYRATKFGCWQEDGWPGVHHTCSVLDPLHTGPHLCCCGYEWDVEDGGA